MLFIKPPEEILACSPEKLGKCEKSIPIDTQTCTTHSSSLKAFLTVKPNSPIDRPRPTHHIHAWAYMKD